MAWLDDRVWCHPKLADASDSAFRAWVNGIAYASGFATGGILTRGQQRTIGSTDETRSELIDFGLWDELGGGAVKVHDWDEHNAKRDARRAADRERKRQDRHPSGAEPPQDIPQDAPADSPQDVPMDRRTLTGDRVTSDLQTSEEDPWAANAASSDTDAIDDVYAHWRRQRGRTAATYDKISAARRKKIATRLREFTVEQLQQAIENVAIDPWPERPQHDDILVIFRSREQVERFLEMRPAANGQTVASQTKTGGMSVAEILEFGRQLGGGQ